ncbi:MAG: hypothetical protein AAF413_02760 [Patescibacteria group bacterium]
MRKVRLTYILIFLLVVYALIAYLIPSYELSKPLLTLFSANSFLYGFYISPIVKDQNARIISLQRQIQAESIALYTTALKLLELPSAARKKVRSHLDGYVHAVLNYNNLEMEEKVYEEFLSYLIKYKGKDKDAVNDIIKDLITNQKNRAERHMLLKSNKVYKNEWIVMGLLFSTTILFILIIDTQQSLIFPLVKALICSGLTMLIVILVKMSTLTHKRAHNIWDPLDKLYKSNYHRID